MKKITFILSLLITSLSFSQTQTDVVDLTFDAASSLDDWDLVDTGFLMEQSKAFNATGNPTGAIDFSGLADLTTNGGAGRSYQFAYRDEAFDFGNASTLSVSFDIKIDNALVGTNLIFQTQVSRNGGGVVVVNTDNIQNGVNLGEWTRLTYNMTPTPADFDNNGNFLLLFFNMAAGAFDGAGGTFSVDNLVVTATENPPTCDDGIQNGNETGVDCGGPDCAPCIEAPTVGPTAPSLPQGDVLSVYSDTYTTDVTNFNLIDFANNNNDITQVDLAGNNVVRIEDYAFYGARWDAVDVTANNFVHIDYYAQTASSFQFFILDESLGSNTGDNICCGNPQEPRYIVGGTNADVALVQGQWVSLDIPLTAFSNFAALADGTWDGTDAIQWKFEGQGILYFDNIYFFNNATASNDEFSLNQLKISPNPSNDVWNIESSSVSIETVEVYDLLGKRVLNLSPNSQEVRIDASGLRTGVYLAKLSTNGATKTIKLVKN